MSLCAMALSSTPRNIIGKPLKNLNNIKNLTQPLKIYHFYLKILLPNHKVNYSKKQISIDPHKKVTPPPLNI